MDEMVDDVSAWATPLAAVAFLAVPEVLVGRRGQVEAVRGLKGRQSVDGRSLRGLAGPDCDGPEGRAAWGPCVDAVDGRGREQRVWRRREQVPRVPGRRRQVL